MALDLDGTLHRDGVLFACTLPFLERLRELGIGWTFLTNNCSKSTGEYVRFLRIAGLRRRRRMFTRPPTPRWSICAAPCRRWKSCSCSARKAWRASWGRRGSLSVAGKRSRTRWWSASTRRWFYERLCKAAYWISRGKPFVATHPDLVCPTGRPTVLVDCGSICAALEKATGRAPDAVPGKPDPLMLGGLLRRRGVQAGELPWWATASTRTSPWRRPRARWTCWCSPGRRPRSRPPRPRRRWCSKTSARWGNGSPPPGKPDEQTITS